MTKQARWAWALAAVVIAFVVPWLRSKNLTEFADFVDRVAHLAGSIASLTSDSSMER